MPFLFAGIALVVLVAVVNQWRRQEGRPKPFNHQRKLAKEILKSVPLRSREWRQLKMLADEAPVETPLASPLTLLLCPSVLAKSIRARQARGVKIDRKTLSAVARKAGVTREMLGGEA